MNMAIEDTPPPLSLSWKEEPCLDRRTINPLQKSQQTLEFLGFQSCNVLELWKFGVWMGKKTLNS